MTSNNESTPQQPQVSSLPIPVPDTPLVIDLPDGQKLVVGNLAPGSVIEVATWRGTGRPDSRTSRLMLGMSTPGSQNAASAEPEQEPAVLTGKALFWHRTKTVFSFLTGIGEKKQESVKTAKPKKPEQSGRRAIAKKASVEKPSPPIERSRDEVAAPAMEKLTSPTPLIAEDSLSKREKLSSTEKLLDSPVTITKKTHPRATTSPKVSPPKQGETPDYDAGIDTEIESFWAKYKK